MSEGSASRAGASAAAEVAIPAPGATEGTAPCGTQPGKEGASGAGSPYSDEFLSFLHGLHASIVKASEVASADSDRYTEALVTLQQRLERLLRTLEDELFAADRVAIHVEGVFPYTVDLKASYDAVDRTWALLDCYEECIRLLEPVARTCAPVKRSKIAQTLIQTFAGADKETCASYLLRVSDLLKTCGKMVEMEGLSVITGKASRASRTANAPKASNASKSAKTAKAAKPARDAKAGGVEELPAKPSPRRPAQESQASERVADPVAPKEQPAASAPAVPAAPAPSRAPAPAPAAPAASQPADEIEALLFGNLEAKLAPAGRQSAPQASQPPQPASSKPAAAPTRQNAVFIDGEDDSDD